MARQDAYKIVQRGAMESWATGEPLQSILAKEPMVGEVLTPEALAGLFDHGYHLAHIDTAFTRLGIGRE
jgi:adenylosuccinate lyase